MCCWACIFVLFTLKRNVAICWYLKERISFLTFIFSWKCGELINNRPKFPQGSNQLNSLQAQRPRPLTHPELQGRCCPSFCSHQSLSFIRPTPLNLPDWPGSSRHLSVQLLSFTANIMIRATPPLWLVEPDTCSVKKSIISFNLQNNPIRWTWLASPLFGILFKSMVLD